MSYRQPDAYLGQCVLWYPDGDRHQEPIPALVTRVSGETLCLSILHSDNHNLVIRDGVRHVSDPRNQDHILRENGSWEHTPLHEEFLGMRQVLAEVVADKKRANVKKVDH